LPQAIGLGVDLSDAALAVARENAQRLGLSHRVDFKKSDWNSQINGLWDVVLSNPPYIPTEEIPKLAPEVAQYEPRLALDGGGDGLCCYRAIIQALPELLAESGIAVIEAGAGQADAIAELGVVQGLLVVKMAQDLSGITRCVVIQKNVKRNVS